MSTLVYLLEVDTKARLRIMANGIVCLTAIGYVLQYWCTLSVAVAFATICGVLMCVASFISYSQLPQINVLLVGSGPRARDLRHTLRSGGGPYTIVGCVDDEYIGQDPDGDNYLGPIERLPDLLKQHTINAVMVALPVHSKYKTIQHVTDICSESDVDAFSFAFTLSRNSDQYKLYRLTESFNGPRQVLKRVIDIVLASVALFLLLPILAITAIVVKLTSSGPIIFKQKRFGLQRRSFTMFKFRTMIDNPDKAEEALAKWMDLQNQGRGPVFKLSKDPRVTPVGSFLRRTSLDELPQLINVLRGDMSLVGPRPMSLRDISYLENAGLTRRFTVKPGMTGLWRISKRSDVTFDERMRLDLKYIDHWSLSLDFRILLRSLSAILRTLDAER